jgi:hypothetical protein
MVTITVKNLKLQFDSFDAGADQHTVHDIVDAVNEVLRQRFSDSQPQLRCTDNDFEFDVKYHDSEIQECVDNETHLKSCDDDGFCNECGNQ